MEMRRLVGSSSLVEPRQGWMAATSVVAAAASQERIAKANAADRDAAEANASPFRIAQQAASAVVVDGAHRRRRRHDGRHTRAASCG